MDDIGEIKGDIKEIKTSLLEHMRRTTLNEERIEKVEKHIETNTEILQLVVKQGDKAADRQLRVIKICLGVFGALAGLATALAAWFSHNS